MASALTLTATGLAAADPAAEISGDGLYLVNIDIRPGTYESAGTPNEQGCWWRRLWKVQTDTDIPKDPNYYIIASDYTRQHPTRVEIKSTDVAFSTENCGTWRMVPPVSTGSFG
ncbi:hypothetical protein JK358_09520 [Nocardia sp. 2]|uniref:Secreted protein n=2 Tax=Nocardia acididurans TaxID=2802282 RepID=A0ABS1M375_9NOCA|nr:hypothetical protein [Nocardia acididurans]